MKWVVIILVICLFEAFTKGWMSFQLVPASVAILPLTFLLQLVARQHHRRFPSRDLLPLAHLQLGSLALFYISTIGFGDTQETLLFGFLTSTTESVLTQASELVMIVAGLTALITSLLLLLRVTIYDRFGGKGKVIAITIATLLITYFALGYILV